LAEVVDPGTRVAGGGFEVLYKAIGLFKQSGHPG
jgi:hypothetical protein